MRYQEKIYNQSGNNVRNRDLLNVNMSSDICIFTAPTFNVSGATKIQSGTTSSSVGVYIVDDISTNISLLFEFTGNTNSLNDTTKFKFEIYKYDSNNQIFSQPAIYKSDNFDFESFSATSALTVTIPIQSLNIDGDYLVKGYYIHDLCTDILGRLSLKNDTSEFKLGSQYGIYEPLNDYYFIVCKKADKPIFISNAQSNSRPLGSLVAFSILPEEGETQFIINTNIQGDLLFYLNGLLLSQNLDYKLTNNIITLSSETKTNDIITYVSVANSQTNGLIVDNIHINDSIVSGTTNNQGSNKYYYNTIYNKFEIYTNLTPISGNDIVITLNGITLAPNIDYYQSISNPKRIILEGDLLNGDIINIIYNAFSTVNGEIYTNSPLINWTISAPQMNNGEFTLEVATDNTFTNIISSAITEYIVNEVSYSANVVISGAVGTNLVYRVLNEKNYVSTNGDIITTTAYSDIIPITIMSNTINSY